MRWPLRVLGIAIVAGACGCGGQAEPRPAGVGAQAEPRLAGATPQAGPNAAQSAPAPQGVPASPSQGVAAPSPRATEGAVAAPPPRPAESEEDASRSAAAEGRPAAGPAPRRASLDEQLAGLQVPPAWLEAVSTAYDTSHPWKEARLEVRRLLGLNTEEARKEAVKLTWVYLKKGDIGDGHEYPMYLFLGGEPLWAVRAHEEFLARPHKETPIHAHMSLASLYARFGEFDKAKALLDAAMAALPAPPWRIARQADLHAAYGDLYAAWGRTDDAREHYAEAVRLYPTSNQPYGQHLLKRQAGRVQSKLDLLTARSLAGAALRDGRYTATTLGYAGDLDVTLTVRDGKIADVQLKHQEKIDQGACVVIPQRIVEKQSVLVDGISGATITKDAIVDGALRCLRQAGLP